MRPEEIIHKALEYTENDSYKLALLVGQRAKQLLDGDIPLVQVTEDNLQFTDIALKEIAEGKIGLKNIEKC
ncbi:MAG: Unknown protein [uncultured Campylobacterales bacterium]|uniref:DNA-directed RNA polymerase subunit omega n=1 Tax=uncultured Campylobacterales bacterium TaxID=352960 RepID=A0A6S6SKF1_9BACT|nr:MAG: Unknown protein [uncultured Campylobacterales bacterium]